MTITARIYELKNPKLLLQGELTRRIQRNPRYSMRRFARALGMSHTVLSLVLSGKRPLSKKAASLVSDVLGLDPTQREKLIFHRKPERKSDELEQSLDGPEESYRQISLDTFTVVSDWYHFAILSLLDLPKARLESKWISARLGISEIEAKLAIERLVRLGLVKQVPNGASWKQAGQPIKIDNQHSTSATRKFHAQLLAKASESLEQDPFEERDFTSMTLALDSKELPYAREKIRKFRRELAKDLETRGKPDRVYNLSVQIFPLSKTTPLEES